MDKARAMFVEGCAMWAILCVVGCSGADNFQGGLVMKVHSIHYKDASVSCHDLEAKSVGKDPATFKSEPTHACREVKGPDCYVYTDESAKHDAFDLRRKRGGSYPLSHLYGHFGLVRRATWTRPVVGEGVMFCPRAGCGRSASPDR
jgi:hypothetical protein